MNRYGKVITAGATVRFLVVLLSLVLFIPLSAQTVTPVDVDDEKPQQPILHYYDKHGDPLKEPVLFLATLDTVQKAKPGPVYPVFNGVTVGFNFMDGIMLLAGQKYCNFNLEANVSLWNWLFPVVEAGLGRADSRPEELNFRYRTGWNPFVKIGFDYNFLYKSNPAYKVYVGYRAGWCHTKYDLTDITISSSYWDENLHPDLLNNKATGWYGEAVAGLKVNLWKGIGLGWSIRYRHKYHVSHPKEAQCWFLPGYGASSLGATFALYYSF